MFGKKKDLTEVQVKNLNKLLEEMLGDKWYEKVHSDAIPMGKTSEKKWSSADFKNPHILLHQVNNLYVSLRSNLHTQKHKLKSYLGSDYDTFKDELLSVRANKIIIFNTDLYEAKPIGMVDVGQVKRFGTASTGNRFENGVIGYAIEQASDEVWSKNNAQENSLNEVKSDLLKKAKILYPECNTIFKFEADFREMGSSGNVFIYLRGTAAIGSNKGMLAVEQEIEELVRLRDLKKEEIEIEIVKYQVQFDKINLNINKIPKSEFDIEKMLG